MRIKDGHWLISTPIAHRGLHGAGAPENSIESFLRAAQKNFAIELDVRLTKDGEVAVFHDAGLLRMTGAKGRVIEYTYQQLCRLKLIGGGKIPLLAEALSAVNGKVPFLIEIKDQPERKDIVEKTLQVLKDYKGEYALQSFNPFYVRKFRKLAPHILRGQLATKYPEGQSAVTSYMLRHFFFNIMTKPDFISFNIDDLPYPPAKRKNIRLITWTVDTEQKLRLAQKNAENIIFEHIDPYI